MKTTKTTTQGKTLQYHTKDHIYESGHVSITVSGNIIAQVYKDLGEVKVETRGPFCVGLTEAVEAEAFLKECHEAERREQRAFKTEVTFTFLPEGRDIRVECNDVYFGTVDQAHGDQACQAVPGLVEAARKWAGWTP